MEEIPLPLWVETKLDKIANYENYYVYSEVKLLTKKLRLLLYHCRQSFTKEVFNGDNHSVVSIEDFNRYLSLNRIIDYGSIDWSIGYLESIFNRPQEISPSDFNGIKWQLNSAYTISNNPPFYDDTIPDWMNLNTEFFVPIQKDLFAKSCKVIVDIYEWIKTYLDKLAGQDYINLQEVNILHIKLIELGIQVRKMMKKEVFKGVNDSVVSIEDCNRWLRMGMLNAYCQICNITGLVLRLININKFPNFEIVRSVIKTNHYIRNESSVSSVMVDANETYLIPDEFDFEPSTDYNPYEDYGRSTSMYGGYQGYSDDDIRDAFEGDPSLIWNVD